jgi:hypothetical protein
VNKLLIYINRIVAWRWQPASDAAPARVMPRGSAGSPSAIMRWEAEGTQGLLTTSNVLDRPPEPPSGRPAGRTVGGHVSERRMMRGVDVLPYLYFLPAAIIVS